MRGFAHNTATVALAIAAATPPAFAEGFACFVIQPGDTAATLAWQLTGDRDHRHQSWFQIVEPAASRYVPKGEYHRIYPGWHACVPQDRLRPEWAHLQVAPPPARREAAAPPAGIVDRLTTPGVAAIAGVALLAVASLLAWHVAAAWSSGRQTLVLMMTFFGERFVREFERPLMRPGSNDRAVRSQLRVKPRQRRLDILLAPIAGHSYPNLSDHRKNVEYDVGRVLRLLNDERFVSERLSRQGEWVIVRCRFRPELATGGGP